MSYKLELVIFPPGHVQALGFYIMVSRAGITIFTKNQIY